MQHRGHFNRVRATSIKISLNVSVIERVACNIDEVVAEGRMYARLRYALTIFHFALDVILKQAVSSALLIRHYLNYFF